MKNFTDWYIFLIEDERFYEHASRNHKKETIEETARKVYETESLNPVEFTAKEITEHRRHILYKLYKLPADKAKKNWYEIEVIEKKANEPEWKPVSWEERAKRLKEFQAMVDASPLLKPPAPLSAREKMNQDWRPLPEEIKEPTQEEKLIALANHRKAILTARTKMFREKYPNGTVKELRSYLKKFKDI